MELFRWVPPTAGARRRSPWLYWVTMHSPNQGQRARLVVGGGLMGPLRVTESSQMSSVAAVSEWFAPPS